MQVNVVKKVLKANDQFAAMVRERLGDSSVVALNLISGPGSGKTSLIESTIRTLGDTLRISVIEGDPDTARDAERIAALGVPVVQINTDGGCHLDAHLVYKSLDAFDLANLHLLLIENVGNMVCPVEFDLGEAGRVALTSTSEGHDKPVKYPRLFREADLIILNKTDLLPFVDFDREAFLADLGRVHPDNELVMMSCRTGEGMQGWVQWLKRFVANGGKPTSTHAKA